MVRMEQSEKDLLNEVFSIIAEQMEMAFEQIDALRSDVAELQERVGMWEIMMAGAAEEGIVDAENRPEY